MPEVEWKGGQHQHNYRKLASEKLGDYIQLYVDIIDTGYNAKAEFELLTEIQNFTAQIINDYYKISPIKGDNNT